MAHVSAAMPYLQEKTINHSPHVDVPPLHFVVRDDFVMIEPFDDNTLEGTDTAEGDIGLAVVGDAAEVDEDAV